MARSIYQGEAYDKVYKMRNYKIAYDERNKHKNNCAIYCSSSNLYFPNTEEEFCKELLLRDDKYEWKEYIVEGVYKHIWIRDITKEFYVRGINSDISTIEKLVEFIKEETKGMKTVVVGSSAGGYIATLIGCLINAECVYNFCGFFDLNILDKKTWPLIKEPLIYDENKKWYNLCKYIKESKTTILYFYGAKSTSDCEQAEFIKNYDNVHVYAFDSNTHGIPFKKKHLYGILNSDYIELVLNLNRFEGKEITQIEWDFFWWMRKFRRKGNETFK